MKAVAEAIKHDKNRLGREVAFVLCPKLGEARIQPIPLADVPALLKDARDAT